eukprot:TRINITY_DN22149_c0_g1_i1.p1 TRINITY_DN22149_c0_g1~~TRINITY_DN22149_c0_g1_i1.p1  ORF type:complete len:1143 (-),score=169.46 TRINITY_DN22149_c0_g1_i1:80-3508(-)
MAANGEAPGSLTAERVGQLLTELQESISGYREQLLNTCALATEQQVNLIEDMRKQILPDYKKDVELSTSQVHAAFPREEGQLRIPAALVERMNNTNERLEYADMELTRSMTCTYAGKEAELKTLWRDVFYACEESVSSSRAMLLESEPRESTLFMGSHVFSISQSQLAMEFVPSCVVLHPFSLWRVFWDVLGLVFIIFDIIYIPLQVAFEGNEPWTFSYYSLLVSFVYWSADIYASFTTGYVKVQGIVEMRLTQIAKRYCRTWLPLDVVIVSIDLMFLTLSSAGFLRMVRGVRTIRTLRLVRILKMSKVKQVIEDTLTSLGIQWLTLVIAMVKTFLAIVLLAHAAACTWYVISSDGEDKAASAVDTSQQLVNAYLKSMYWVLGHLIAAPVDASVIPRNDAECAFTLCMLLTSLFVLGAGISKMTNTLAELNKNNEECQHARMKLQRYLRSAGAGAELASRTLRFALDAFKNRSERTLDAEVLELLSHNLKLELAVCQRTDFLCINPCMRLLAENFVSIFSEVCAALVPKVYASQDSVFALGSVSEVLYITSHGSFRMSSVGTGPIIMFERPTCFCELGLYAQCSHTSNLVATTFADAFALSSEAFALCVRNSPKCTQFIYKYARCLLSYYWDGHDVPANRRPLSDVVPTHLSSKACNVINSEVNALDGMHVATRKSSYGELEETIAALFSERKSAVELMETMELTFLEVGEVQGLYAKLDSHDERKRALCAMLCVYWLLRDDYEAFTCGQHRHTRMSKETWAEFQSFIKWVDLEKDQIVAILTFLAVRGIGKVQAVSNSAPACNSPEAVVEYVMLNYSHLVPTCAILEDGAREKILSVLKVHSSFNFAQMLQAENAPRQVAELKDLIEEQGEGILKFYLLGLVAVMCALGGASSLKGSTFMNEANAKNVLFGVKHLQQLNTASPQAIYWGYLECRAKCWNFEVRTIEDFALTRISALCRSTSHISKELLFAWKTLSVTDRMVLVDHFLADGISEAAFVFAFLPLLFANVRANPALSMKVLFYLLIDLVESLVAEGFKSQFHKKSLLVDVRDLAEIAEIVKSPRVFSSVLGHTKLVFINGRAKLTVDRLFRQESVKEVWANDHSDKLLGIVTSMDRTMRHNLAERRLRESCAEDRSKESSVYI